MNTYFNRLVAAICIAMIFVLNNTSSFAGNYTWTGNTSSAWSVSSNWSPSGVPGTNDTVTIGSGSDTIVLASNRTISRLVINGRTLNLGDYELEVSQKATLSGGIIYNGTLKLRGALVTFSGTHTDCLIDCITGQLEFNGGVFDGEGSFEQNGTGNGYGTGGCVFNAPITIKKSTNALLRLGTAIPDTFNSRVEFICVNKMPLEISYGSTSVFNDIVMVSCYGSSSEITIGNDTDTVQFNGDAALATGSEGLTDGVVILKRISQSGRGDNELSGDEEFVIHIESCTFNGGMLLTAPSILLKNSVFWGDVTLTKIRAASNNYSYGGNSFYGRATLENQDGTTAFRLANNAGDHFYNDVVFASSSNRIQMAYSGNNYFEGNISINSSDIKFNTSSGKVVLTGDKNQTLEGTDPYLLGKLQIDKTAGTVQLDQQMTIDSSITFVNGIINTDSVITLKAVTTCSGASNLSFVDGPVKKIGNTAFVFPVGDEGTFFPVGISNPTLTTDAFTARYHFQTPFVIGDTIDTSLTSISRCNYWTLNRNNGSAQVVVTLQWDSIGCMTFDTTGLRFAYWDGVVWKSSGQGIITGDYNIGSIKSESVMTNYQYFTLGRNIPVTNIGMSLGASRSIPPDFFGLNGGNTTDIDQGFAPNSWKAIFNFQLNSGTGLKMLAPLNVDLFRYPAGTPSNYFDWKTGWHIREAQLPEGWLYNKFSLKKEPLYIGNDWEFVKDNYQLSGARPLLAWNLLTSKFTYEIASVYQLGIVNLPVRYIELGNEFYLNEEQYKDIFPNVKSYYDKASKWIKDFKNLHIPQTNSVQFAVIGADVNPKETGRKRMWLPSMIDLIDVSDGIDAITIHDYIGAGYEDIDSQNPPCLQMGANFLRIYLNKAMIESEKIQQNTFSLIQQANAGKLASHPLQIWLTEYNNLESQNSYIGTWPHGLVNALMTLRYLETPEITKITSHTMLSDGVFGNLFESNQGFANIPCHGTITSGLTTKHGEFTAIGNALNVIAAAMKDAVTCYPLTFSGNVNVIDLNDPGNPFPALYGWCFEYPTGEREVIILNLDFSSTTYSLNSFGGIFNASTLTSDIYFSQNIQEVVYGNAINNAPSLTNLVNTVSNFPSANSAVLLPGGSLIRIHEIRPLIAELTDDEICSKNSTSLIIRGGDPGYVVAFYPSGLTMSNLAVGSPTGSDKVLITAPSLTSTQVYTITITDNNNATTTCTLTVHPPINNFHITEGTQTDPAELVLTQGTPITLTSSFAPGAGGTSNTGNPVDYHFVWIPDSGIISTTCSTSTYLPFCPSITVGPERTTNYTVFITDDQCWDSKSVTVVVPVSKVDLGPDLVVCQSSPDIHLKAEIEADAGSLSYAWSNNALSQSITIDPGGLSIGDHIFTLTVTGIYNSISYSKQDEVIVKVLDCCTSSTAVVLNPTEKDIPYTNYKSFYSDGDDLYSLLQSNDYYFEFPNDPVNDNTLLTIDHPNQTIIINGELRLGDDIKQTGSILHDGYDVAIKDATLQFGPESFIRVRGGRTLTLEDCTLDVCSAEMWNGLRIFGESTDAGPHIVLKNCSIINANMAVQLAKDAQYEIENCYFGNNYIDVHFSGYQQKVQQNITGNGSTALSSTNYLRSNTFTSSGGYLLAPYNTVHKFAAIVLDDVERVVIGDSSLDGSVSANVFENSNYGIYANNTGFEVYNCTFSSISPLDQSLALNKYYGSCIYSKSSSDYNDRHAIVGNKDYSLSYPATSKQNHFYSSYQGIVSLGEMNLKVFNNEFGDPDVASEGPSVFSVLTGNSSIKQVYIARENTFNNFNVGVRAFGLNYQGLYHIGDNYFEKAKPNIPSNPTAYQGTAIWVGNSLRLPGVAETPYLKIFNNRIGNPETNTQARIGIFVSSIVDPLIEYNDIYYQVDAVPSYPAVGIWTQNCMNPKVVDNDILNTESYASHSNLMTGIRSDMNTQGCFSRNHLNYLGNSFHFMGPHGQVGFAENEMNYYDNAIFINNAEIGVQGFADINNSIYRTDDNKFYHDLLSQPERVIGSAINNLPISWYYNNSDNQLYNPDINGNIPTSLLFEIGLTPNLDPIECPEIINPIARNMAYGFIVRDTARYDETYAQYFSYHAKRGMYNILKRNPQLLDMDDSTDVFYNTFFDEMQLSNLAKFDSVYQFTEAGEIASAHAILNSIEDTNAIEEYCKAAFGIGINKLNLDSALSNADSSAFYEIADMHALTTGEAAFISRNMLFYEIHDGVLGGGSRLAQIRKPQKTTFKVELYPVPVKDLVYFIYENGIPDVVEIYDVQHRCILKTGNVHRIELSLLSPGSYIVRFLQDNDVLTTKKLIKVQ